MGVLDMLDAQPEPATTVPGSSQMRNLFQAARIRQIAELSSDDDDEYADELSQMMLQSSPGRLGPSITGLPRNFPFNNAPIRPIDVGGADQVQRMADFVATSIEDFGSGLTVDKAVGDLGLQSKLDLLPGLEVRLLPHQLIGVSWMVKQEKETPHQGGILADDMGLGKTVQMIACMAANQPSETDGYRTTLVVVPAALMHQWKEEIETKTNNLFTVHIHHGKDKLKKVSELKSRDVIITTYHTLINDFALKGNVKEADEQEWISKNGGVLARCKYYRVILDEAHFIRNRSTRASTAVALIRAKYRWCLTGTPVINSLADLYGLIRFGHFRPWNDWNEFNERVVKMEAKDTPLAGTRAQTILKALTMRRRKDDMLDGKPIIELPPKEIEFEMAEFSESELAMYNYFEKKTHVTLNKLIKAGTLLKNHNVILVLLLRLRQMCNHPALVLEGTEGFDPASLVSDEREKEYGRAVRAMGVKWASEVKRAFFLRRKYAGMEDDELDAGTCPVCKEVYEPGTGRVLKCQHELCIDCLTDLNESAITHDGIFGQGDERENTRAEQAWEDANKKGLRPCPTCKAMQSFKSDDIFKSVAFEPTDEELQAAKQKKRKGLLSRRSMYDDDDIEMVEPEEDKKDVVIDSSFRETLDDSDDDLPDPSEMFKSNKKPKLDTSKKKDGDDQAEITMEDIKFEVPKAKPAPSSARFSRLKRDSAGRLKVKKESTDDDDRPDDAVWEAWRKTGHDAEPSAKMLAMIDLLAEWEKSHPDDKVIIYSQWTSMLDIVECIFTRYGIRTLRYDGKMKRDERERTLKIFKGSSGPKIILISTKCGGVGLNLVAANRVINLDVSWNFAAESQAYDRVHRLGQDKNVYIKRLLVRDTIEERILKLQDVKTGLSDAALGEGTGVKLNKMSVKDIKLLFGMRRAHDDSDED